MSPKLKGFGMIDSDFTAAMTTSDLQAGKALHSDAEPSRKLAMAAGLTKSSEELARSWEAESELYVATLKGAISVYENNKNLEELLVGCIARLTSVVDEESEITEKAS